METILHTLLQQPLKNAVVNRHLRGVGSVRKIGFCQKVFTLHRTELTLLYLVVYKREELASLFTTLHTF